MKTDKRTRVRACPDCALLAESVPLAVRLTRLAERADRHADALEGSVMTLLEKRRARRWAAIRRWRGLAHAWRKRAREARGTVEYRCTACALRASMKAEDRAAWSSAGETGVVALPDGTAYGTPEMALPFRAGKYGPPAPTITIARVKASDLEAEDTERMGAESRTLARILGMLGHLPERDLVVPLDPDALACGREVEARTDWQTLAPGERIDGLRIVHDGWSHARPDASQKARRADGRTLALVPTCLPSQTALPALDARHALGIVPDVSASPAFTGWPETGSPRCVVSCPCGQRYVMGLSHVCAFVQRAGTLRVEHRREDGSRKSASAQAHERRERKASAMKAEIARAAMLTAEARAREIVAAAAPVEDYRDTAH